MVKKIKLIKKIKKKRKLTRAKMYAPAVNLVYFNFLQQTKEFETDKINDKIFVKIEIYILHQQFNYWDSFLK